jgi:hypothetical protein
MTGWKLRDRDGHVYRFSAFTLRPGGRVRVHTGWGSDKAGNLYWDSNRYVWNNDGDRALLRRQSRSLVNRCYYNGVGSVANC